jgi:hypothetical protein
MADADAPKAEQASGPKRRRGGRGGKGGGGGRSGDTDAGAEGSQPESANPPAAEGGEPRPAKPKGGKGKGGVRFQDSSDAHAEPLTRRPHPPAAFHELAEEQVRHACAS